MSKRDDILEIASVTFREHGYQKANLTYIAGQCGMNKAGLYYYFNNKEDLFMSMLQKDIGNVKDKLTSILSAPGNMYQRLRSFMVYRTSSIGLMKKYLDMFSQGVAPPKLRNLAFNVKHKFNEFEIELLTGFLYQYAEKYNLKINKPYYLVLTLIGVSEKIGIMTFHKNDKLNIEETIEEVLQLLPIIPDHPGDSEKNHTATII